MLMRRGSGSIKHLEVRDLWGQELVRRLGVSVVKIPREFNVPDMLASPGSHSEFHEHLNKLGVQYSVQDRQLDLNLVLGRILLPASRTRDVT